MAKLFSTEFFFFFFFKKTKQNKNKPLNIKKKKKKNENNLLNIKKKKNRSRLTVIEEKLVDTSGKGEVRRDNIGVGD